MDKCNWLKFLFLWNNQNIGVLSVFRTGQLAKKFLLWIFSLSLKRWIWRMRLKTKLSFILFTLKVWILCKIKIILLPPILSPLEKWQWEYFCVCISWFLSLANYKWRYIALCRQDNIKSVFIIKLLLTVYGLNFKWDISVM